MDAEAPPSRRGRWTLIAVVMLLLIFLPLYLWPLRGGLGSPPRTAAVQAGRPDPRNAAALAGIPGDVWDALMGRTRLPEAGAGPRNLTMISPLDELAAAGLLPGVHESPLSDDPAVLARAMIDRADGLPDQQESPESDGVPVPAGELLAARLAHGSGTGNPWSGFGPGGYSGPGDFGPWHGGGPRLSSSGPAFTPGDPGAPTPTPEPGTLLLVGSNLAVLGVAAWRRRRRRQLSALDG
jgi:hypothetical protein